MTTIGNNVKKIRKYLKLSQSQLAERVRKLTGRCSQQTIANIENGNIRESSLLPYVALALNVKLDHLNPNIGKGKLKSQIKLTPKITQFFNSNFKVNSKKDSSDFSDHSFDNFKLDEEIPVFGTMNLIHDDFILTDTPIEYVKRPHVVTFEKDAFGISIANRNIEPIFKIGDIIILHPRKIAKKGNICLFLKVDNNLHIYTMGELIEDHQNFWLIKYYNPEKERKICKKTWQNYFTVVSIFI